eukprot:scaffold15210_cov81-Phaeocystis_antarctica.AAC.2
MEYTTFVQNVSVGLWRIPWAQPQGPFSPKVVVEAARKVACALVLGPVKAAVDGAALLVLLLGGGQRGPLRLAPHHERREPLPSRRHAGGQAHAVGCQLHLLLRRLMWRTHAVVDRVLDHAEQRLVADRGRGGSRAEQQRPRERAEGVGRVADLGAVLPRAVRDALSGVAAEGNLFDLGPAELRSGVAAATALASRKPPAVARGVLATGRAVAHMRTAWPNSWPQPKATPTRSADSTSTPHDATHSRHSSPCSS